jgi:hypothetical protein
MEIEVGKVMELDNGSSYLIGEHFLHDGQEYVSLIATQEPVHMRFAALNEEEGQVSVEMVEDEDLINLFKEFIINDFVAPVIDDQDLEDIEDEEETEEDFEF